MVCREVFSCLCFYLDGELDSEKAGEVEMHLRSCPACRRELEIQIALKYLLQRRLGSVAAPDYLRRRVHFELGRAEEYRESGIQVLDLILWGTHIAQFYNTKDDVPEDPRVLDNLQEVLNAGKRAKDLVRQEHQPN